MALVFALLVFAAEAQAQPGSDSIPEINAPDSIPVVQPDSVPVVQPDSIPVVQPDSIPSNIQPDSIPTPAQPDSIPAAEPTPAAKATSDPHGPPAPKTPVYAQFVKHKVKQGPDSLYFNVCKVVNTTAAPVEGRFVVSIPSGWNLISTEEQFIRVEAGETKYIPVRLSMSQNVIGGRTYVVNGGFTTTTYDSYLANAYVTIPTHHQWKTYVNKRMMYFNQNFGMAEYKIYVENKSNTEENFKINFNVGKNLVMHGEDKYRDFAYLTLPANTDSALTYYVKWNEDPDEDDLRSWMDNRILIEVANRDEVRNLNVWFRPLESEFDTGGDNVQAPLNIQVLAQNVLDAFSPQINFQANGTVLMKNESMASYSVRHNDAVNFNPQNGMSYGEYLWKFSRLFAHYRNPNMHAMLGDISVGTEQTVFGRGGSVRYTANNTHELSAGAVVNILQDGVGGDANYCYAVNQSNKIGLGATYHQDDFNLINRGTVYGKAQFTVGPNSFRIQGGYSQKDHLYNDSSFVLNDTAFVQTDDPDTSFTGYGGRFEYYTNYKKLNINLTSFYGSEQYAGVFAGQLQVNGNAIYSFNAKNALLVQYREHIFNPPYYFRGVLQQQLERHQQVANINWQFKMKNNVTLATGPSVMRLKSTRYDYFNDTLVQATTLSPGLNLRMFYNPSRYVSIGPWVFAGYSQAIDFDTNIFNVTPEELAIRTKPYPSVRAGLNLRFKNWGVYAAYNYGPFSDITQNSYLYEGIFNKNIQIRPYINTFLIKDRLRFTSYSGYSFSAVSNAETININGNFEAYLNGGWTVISRNTVYMYSRYTLDLGKVQQRIFNMSLGVRKAFDIAQPRAKYHDLTVVAFKDLNGNQVLDEDERALDNIFVSVELDTGYTQQGNFSPRELVTDENGELLYKNIPAGNYRLKILPLENMKNLYNVNGAEQMLTVGGETTYYIPFAESNKIVGKVELERAEFSQEGRVDISSIRITAADTMGHEYHCLTDREGNFTLYVPQSTTEYEVSIRNVLGEKFYIKQDRFVVQFNGLKVFDVSFVFKEKERKRRVKKADPEEDESSAEEEQDE